MKHVTFFVALMLFAARAAAGETADEIAKRNAQARFDEGMALAAKGAYEEARIKFVQAYAVFKTPNVLFNLAMAEKKSGHFPEAATHFRQVMVDARTAPDAKDKAKSSVDELSRETGRISITAPAGSDVTLDGAPIGKAPLPESVDVMPGTHAIAASLNGKRLEKAVTVMVGTEEKCEIADEIPPIKKDDNVRVVEHPTPQTTTSFWSTGRFIGLSMMGAGVATSGFIIGFAVAAGVASSQASQLRQQIGDVAACAGSADPRCARLASATDAKHGNESAAIAFGVVSGALVLGGAAVMLFSPGRAKRTGVRVMPALGGITIDGVF